MGTPLDVEPRRRRLSWAVFVTVMLLYSGYAIYVLYARVVERRNPTVSVEFRKTLNYLHLPALLTFYFPLNQRLAHTPPNFVVAPNDASPRAPSTLNLTCVADRTRVGQRLGQNRHVLLPAADVSEAVPPSATGTIKVLTLDPAFFNCRAIEGGSYESCKATYGASLVVREVPYTVRGNCNVTVAQAADIANLKGHWNRLGGPNRKYDVKDEIPGPVLISFDTHNLYLNMSAADSDRKTPFLTVGIHGLFFTDTSAVNKSSAALESVSLERGATYVMHYPKGPTGFELNFSTPQPDISSWWSLNNNTLYNFDQFTVDPFTLASDYIFNNRTRGIFNAVGPTLSTGFLRDGSEEERVISDQQERQMYQLPGAVSGVTLLPSQFVPLDKGSYSLKERDAADEDTRWIASATGFRAVGREFILGEQNQYRMTHPVNLGLFPDARGVQVSRQIDPLAPTVIYTILFTGLSTVLAIFSCVFIPRPEYSELVMWPALEKYVDGCWTRRQPPHIRSESSAALNIHPSERK